MHGRLWWHAFKPNWSRILRLRKRVLVALWRAGETDLVERTLTEHEDMRSLIAQDRPENLARFAELLTAHIRFESRPFSHVRRSCWRRISCQSW